MQRIRTVKPDLFKHEALFDLEKETGLPIRLAFIGLFTCCDRAGRFKWRPRELKTCILPYDDGIDFSHVLDALATRGLVVKYTFQGDTFGAIPTWAKHQFINNKEPQSDLPNYIDCQSLDASSTREPRVSHAIDTRGVKEGKGREGNGNNGSAPLDLEEMEPIALSHRVIEDLQLSGRMNGIVPAVACAIEFVLKHESGISTKAQAMEFVVNKGKEQLAAGGNLDRFWFESQKWRKKKSSQDSTVVSKGAATPSAVGLVKELREKRVKAMQESGIKQ